MTYADLPLHLETSPTPTTVAAIDEAVAASLGGKLTGLAVEVDFPMRSNRLADDLIGLSAMADAEEKIGAVFDRYIKAHDRDLWVMGGMGIREPANACWAGPPSLA